MNDNENVTLPGAGILLAAGVVVGLVALAIAAGFNALRRKVGA